MVAGAIVGISPGPMARARTAAIAIAPNSVWWSDRMSDSVSVALPQFDGPPRRAAHVQSGLLGTRPHPALGLVRWAGKTLSVGQVMRRIGGARVLM
jgi:hypothetical protein